jgi:predicted transposase/invertase (TIGR01784 family)
MQMYWNKAFTSRMLFNASKAFVRQLDRREDYQLLEPVYGLALIDDTIDNHHTHFYHHYKIVNLEHTNEVIRGMEFVLIELPLFKPETWTEKRVAVLWLRFLKELNEKTKTVAPELLANEHTRSALRICEEGAYSPAEREAYENYWVAAWSRTAELHAGREEGRKEGLAEGFEKGIEKGIEKGEKQSALRIAERLNKKGFSPAEIAETTGLSLTEIETLGNKRTKKRGAPRGN